MASGNWVCTSTLVHFPCPELSSSYPVSSHWNHRRCWLPIIEPPRRSVFHPRRVPFSLFPREHLFFLTPSAWFSPTAVTPLNGLPYFDWLARGGIRVSFSVFRFHCTALFSLTSSRLPQTKPIGPALFPKPYSLKPLTMLPAGGFFFLHLFCLFSCACRGCPPLPPRLSGMMVSVDGNHISL